MFHKWDVDYSSSVSKFQTQKRQEGPFKWPIQSNIAPSPPSSTKNTKLYLREKDNVFRPYRASGAKVGVEGGCMS